MGDGRQDAQSEVALFPNRRQRNLLAHLIQLQEWNELRKAEESPDLDTVRCAALTARREPACCAITFS